MRCQPVRGITEHRRSIHPAAFHSNVQPLSVAKYSYQTLSTNPHTLMTRPSGSSLPESLRLTNHASTMMRAASSLPDTAGISQQRQRCPCLGQFHLLGVLLRDTAEQQPGSAMATVVLRPAATPLFLGGRRDARNSAQDQGTPRTRLSQMSRRFCRVKSPRGERYVDPILWIASSCRSVEG
jgi:hypothetical protein